MASKPSIPTRNVSPHWKTLLSSSLLVLGVPNSIADKSTLPFSMPSAQLSRLPPSHFAHFFFFLCAHSQSCRNPIRDVGTQEELMHPRNARNASWRNQLEVVFDFCQEIKNPNGRSRTLEEKKLLILALRAYLRRKVESMNRTLGSFRLKAIRIILLASTSTCVP
jgi:hypothetical protein